MWRLSVDKGVIRRVDCSRLVELSVDFSAYGSRDNEALIERLATAAPHLRVFRITGESPWQYLSRLTQVRALHIAATRCGYVKLDELASLTNLETLELERHPDANRTLIKSKALEKLTNLRVLALVRFNLKGLAPLGKLTKLTALNLREAPVSNLQPLTALRNLERLDVGGTLVQDEDLMPLAVLPRLRRLVVNPSQDCASLARAFPALQ